MKFPINEQDFIRMWIEAISNPDDNDVALAKTIVVSMNRAYNARLEKGRKEMVNQDEDERV